MRTNAAFLIRCLRHPQFLSGDIDTGFIARHGDALLPPPAPQPGVLAAAARFLVGERARGAAADPWEAQDGFRLSGEAREVIEFVDGEARRTVELVHHRGGALSVAVNGEPVTAPPQAAAMRLASGQIAVMLAGETHMLAVYDPFAAADAAGEASDGIASPMPGKIVQLLVKPGDAVTRGQPLAVLEAMKMEHTLSAPADAVIDAVEVAAGDQVGEGAVIIRFAAAQNNAGRDAA